MFYVSCKNLLVSKIRAVFNVTRFNLIIELDRKSNYFLTKCQYSIGICSIRISTVLINLMPSSKYEPDTSLTSGTSLMTSEQLLVRRCTKARTAWCDKYPLSIGWHCRAHRHRDPKLQY